MNTQIAYSISYSSNGLSIANLNQIAQAYKIATLTKADYTLYLGTPNQPPPGSFKGPPYLVLNKGSMQSHNMLVSQKQHNLSTYLVGMFHRNNCDKRNISQKQLWQGEATLK